MRGRHWFQFVSGGVFALFMGILLYVALVAYSRRPGSTGMDVATIQKVRHEFQQTSSSP